MSMSKEVSLSNGVKVQSKAISLNPNAAEFIPFSLRTSTSPSGSSSSATDAVKRSASSASAGNAALGRLVSPVSNASDDEAHKNWSQQLPDDITPDFMVMSENDSPGLEGLNFARLSFLNGGDSYRFTSSTASGYVAANHVEPSPRNTNRINFIEKLRYAAAPYGEESNLTSFPNMQTNSRDKQIVKSKQILGNGRDVHSNDNQRQGFMNDNIFGDQAPVDENEMNPMNHLELLALRFPGFSGESLADVYYASGYDLHRTVEILMQLELQAGGFNLSANPMTSSALNLSTMGFLAASASDNQNGPSKLPGNGLQRYTHQSPTNDRYHLLNSGGSLPSRTGTDFASALRKLATKDSEMWKFDRNGSAGSTIGSSRSSNVLGSVYGSGLGRSINLDKLQSRSSARAAPLWLETGEGQANFYSELRENAHDNGPLRNAFFEQARKAYVNGDKALAKALNVKGQLYDMHVKATHGRAQESIYRMRIPVVPEMQGNGSGHEWMIDLHGLHVSEAIHVLKHELAVLRSTARAAEQRLQVYIRVGTGHHTRGSRTPARLRVALHHYLLEEEGLDFLEPTPGLLCVVIY